MEDLSRALQAGRYGLWHDPGVGKTPPACMFIYGMWKLKGARTVWAMPSHLMEKNRAELLAWSEFKDNDVVIVDGTRKRKDDLISGNAKVFITTFPGLVGKRGAFAEWEKIKKAHPDFDCVALDEPHKYFSNPEGQSTQELYRCMRQVKYFLPMTGTVIKGKLSSAYPMIQIIEPRYYGNYRDFLAQHALTDEYGKIVAWRNHEKLAEVLKRIGGRKSFEEIYGFRDIIYFIEEVDMSEAQRSTYFEFETMGMAELDKVVMEGSNEGVNLLRLRQICAHPERIALPLERNDKGQITKFQHAAVDTSQTPRDVLIQAHLEDHKETGEPVVIVSTLIPEQERLYKLALSLGMKAALINSTVPNAVRAQIDRDFQAGRIQVVVGSPSTMGTGFNWSHLDHIIFAGIDFNADDFIQVLMRGFRGVRKKALRATLVQYKKSVEQHIDKVLDRKSREANKVDDTYLVLNLSTVNRIGAKNVFCN